MSEKQWVNLPKDPKFLGDGITSIERLGTVSVAVEFGASGPAGFKLRAEPVGAATSYTAGERARNAKFELITLFPMSYKEPGSNRMMIGDTVSLPAAGGDLYRVEAEYDGAVVKSPTTLETWRRLYYQVIVMAPPPVPDPGRPAASITATNLGALESSYESYFIDLKQKAAGSWVPFRRNIAPTAFYEYLGTTVKGVYALKQWEPYSFAALFAHALATPQEIKLTIDQAAVYRNPRAEKWFKKLVGVWRERRGIIVKYDLPDGNYAWYGLDDLEDMKNGGQGSWLVPGSCRFIDDGGSSFDIPDHCVFLDKSGGPARSLGGYKRIGIAIPPHVEAAFQGSMKGRFKLQVRTTKGWALGLAASNLMMVARMACFEPVAEAECEQTANHELGHLVGMTATGGPGEPDAPKTFYGGWGVVAEGGHTGPHCSTGAAWTGAHWIGSPACVMFGAGGAWGTDGKLKSTPGTYCGACETIVKKVDLSKLRCY